MRIYSKLLIEIIFNIHTKIQTLMVAKLPLQIQMPAVTNTDSTFRNHKSVSDFQIGSARNATLETSCVSTMFENLMKHLFLHKRFNLSFKIYYRKTKFRSSSMTISP